MSNQQLILHNDKFFEYRQLGGFSGYVPASIEAKKQEPFMNWTGGKISLSLWQTIIAFFQKYKTDEVQVRLFYNEESGEWKAHAFPQRYPAGMTTREIPDHANFEEDMKMFQPPWVRMGSVHHHCSMGAFQSGTDHGDEKGVVGLHLTVGHLGQPKHDIHARVCVRVPGEIAPDGSLVRAGEQIFYGAILNQWFGLPQAWVDMIPPALHGIVLDHMLKEPVPPEISYPARWDENLIRFQTSSYSDPGSYNYRDGCFGSEWDGHSGHGNIVTLPSKAELARSPAVMGDAMLFDWSKWPEDAMVKISEMIDILSDDKGRFIAPVICTHAWTKTPFRTLMDCQAYLRELRFMQATGGTWCMPKDVQAVRSWMHMDDVKHGMAISSEAQRRLALSSGKDNLHAVT